MHSSMAHQPIVSLEEAKVIQYAATSSLISAMYAIYTGNTDLAAVPFSVFCTSIVYWHWPTYGWRRNIDIINTQICLWWQLYKAANAEYRVYYYSTKSIAILLFGLSWVAHLNNKSWAGTICHTGVHLVANLANIILYSGRIDVPSSL
jgi:hypothetical protein